MRTQRSIVALLSIAAITMLSACDLTSFLGATELCADIGQGHCPVEPPGDPRP